MGASTLRGLFPDGRFAPPAAEAQIAAAEAALGARLPEPLRRFYRECDGFRESRGNAKYLFSLTNEDFIGSLVSVTQSYSLEFRPPVFPGLRGFVLFGSPGGDEIWGSPSIDRTASSPIIIIGETAARESVPTSWMFIGRITPYTTRCKGSRSAVPESQAVRSEEP